ncbi:DUF3817 domain-containing protein [Streptomonospora sp. S1-112]|uniref:DUF3817 domain-containing protein n=1 Tax=Streptomonospora mangrovi TaxID=2883123 RepID=A0A9X3NLE3_9ACTN|nr:DUF3817 domain-containing protein [Streptomonospora mangrovi]MDA0565894.1 DUF3817 domain-containing protein [Streptomonospora mangrovi]
MDNNRLPFLLYRILAYVTGVFLILLTFVSMPAKYLIGETARFSLVSAPAGTEAFFGDDSVLMPIVAIPHGYIYMAYVLVVLWLALGRRWSAARTVGVALAGTIPFAGLIIEHRLTKAEKAGKTGKAGGAGTAAAGAPAQEVRATEAS